MSRKYYLATINMNGSITILNEGTKTDCEKRAIGRWGCIPGFVVITTISDISKIRRLYGFEH
jgi:hypothetical protein